MPHDERPTELDVSVWQRLESAAGRQLQKPKWAARVRQLARSQRRITDHLLAATERLEGYIAFHSASTEPEPPEGVRVLRSYFRHLQAHLPHLKLQPDFSILIYVGQASPQEMRRTLSSVGMQVYPPTDVCLAVPESLPERTAQVIADFASAHPGLLQTVTVAGSADAASGFNECLALAQGTWFTVLNPGDVLFPNALAEFAKRINEEHHATHSLPPALFSDVRVEGDTPADRYATFLSGWSWFTAVGNSASSKLVVFQSASSNRCGDFREGFDGAEVQDLLLRVADHSELLPVHLPISVGQLARSSESAPFTAASLEQAQQGLVQAAQDSCSRRGLPATAKSYGVGGKVRLQFVLPEQLPLISIVIPTKNGLNLLTTCINSVLQRSSYPNFEVVLVDNGTTDPTVWAEYERLQASDSRIRVYSDPGYFNFARLINTGVQEAAGDFVVMLNNDVEVLTPDWLEQMLMFAQFPDVGAVGAKLLYPSGAVQHGGVVGAGPHIAAHSGLGAPGNREHFFVDCVHEAIAVTGAALMISKEVFLSLGQLDEDFVPNAYGDIDICLELRRRQRAVVYTPWAVLIHHESATRRQNVELSEIVYMRRKWGAELLDDPYLNVKLRRDGHYVPDPILQNPEPSAGLLEYWLQAGSFEADHEWG